MATRRKPAKRGPPAEKERTPPATASGRTGSGLSLDVVVGPNPDRDAAYATRLGFPGAPPYT